MHAAAISLLNLKQHDQHDAHLHSVHNTTTCIRHKAMAWSPVFCTWLISAIHQVLWQTPNCVHTCLPRVLNCKSMPPDLHTLCRHTVSCSVFFVGYTVTNICGGYLATRFTAKLILGLGVVVWSVFTILTPLAASTESVYVILACRCVMGAGEGVTFPSIQHLQGKWCPANRRTFCQYPHLRRWPLCSQLS